MSKRCDKFERRERDYYATPYEAVLPLLPHLHGVSSFAEPCAGEGHLVGHLQRHGYRCAYEGDIHSGYDALEYRFEQDAVFDSIISNVPWDRKLMHPMITLFQRIAPTWLLFDADWMHTQQAASFLPNCSHIVTVGRVKWIEGSSHTGKDNVAWYRFHNQHNEGPRFIGKASKP
jgi:hypothetical protein|nr:MAG TPA: hypothetical protein [Caudoviricetes sp.]